MIALSMNRTDYENDIRSLLMAFFYGEKIVLNGEEWNVCLDVRYTENHTALVLKDHNGRSLEKEGDCHFEDYRLGRNDIKNLVYRLLSEYTGMVLPWGTLTGIRPTKLPMEMYESGASRGDAIHYLKDTYFSFFLHLFFYLKPPLFSRLGNLKFHSEHLPWLYQYFPVLQFLLLKSF